MGNKYKIMTKVITIVLSIMLFGNCAFAKGMEKSYPVGETLMVADNREEAALYNTYWMMRSYTGTFYLVFYPDGTYLSQPPVLENMRERGTWSCSGGKLFLENTEYTKHISDNETWYSADVDGLSIGLYPFPNAEGFDEIIVYDDMLDKIYKLPDAKPYIDTNNRLMVPLRLAAEAIDLEVVWDADAQRATFTGDAYYDDRREESPYVQYVGVVCETEVAFQVNNRMAVISYARPEEKVYKTIQMDTVPVIRNGRVYAPIRYLTEAFGQSPIWDGSLKRIILTEGEFIENPFEGFDGADI